MPFQIGNYYDNSSIKNIYSKTNYKKKKINNSINLPPINNPPSTMNNLNINKNENEIIKKDNNYSNKINLLLNDLNIYTNNYKTKHCIFDLSIPLYTGNGLKLIVGNLEAKYSSKIQFYQDRITYIFYHPFENTQIRMIMFYKDMTDYKIDLNNKIFSFRIPHDLCHFKNEYIGKDPTSLLSIKFDSNKTCKFIYNKVYIYLFRLFQL